MFFWYLILPNFQYFFILREDAFHKQHMLIDESEEATEEYATGMRSYPLRSTESLAILNIRNVFHIIQYLLLIRLYLWKNQINKFKLAVSVVSDYARYKCDIDFFVFRIIRIPLNLSNWNKEGVYLTNW